MRRNEQLEPDPQHDELIEWVQKIADASDYTYGVRRMKRALNSLGLEKQRTRALMKPTVRKGNKNISNLYSIAVTRFRCAKTDQAYVSDAYIWTQHLAVDRSDALITDESLYALTMALWQRKPKALIIRFRNMRADNLEALSV